tara:strand:+ start:3239 stop:3412 length:174 start_codon:yes stop_codon:yes gene_type:complete
MSYNLTEKERSALEKYYSDMYFFCPLCEEYHEKTKTTKGEYKTIWWCQMPNEELTND